MADERIDNPDLATYTELNRDPIYQMITGTSPDSLREQVYAIGGTRVAAELTGLTQRTIQRYITEKPGAEKINPKNNPGAVETIGSAFAEARQTREGRERIAARHAQRAKQMRTHGARMKGTARGGVVTAGASSIYLRDRTFDHSVPSETMDLTFNAWLEGGDEAAYATFNGENGPYSDSFSLDAFWITDMTALDFSPDTGRE